MLSPYAPTPDYLTRLDDGTVKQLNPFSGTEVWTVPGRGHRPLGLPVQHPVALDEAEHGRYCAFCEKRYLETPPEKARLVKHWDGRWETLRGLHADQLFHTVAEFRRIPNLFEILSYEYWHANYGFELPDYVERHQEAYQNNPAGREHILAVVRQKLRAAGRDDAYWESLTDEERFDFADGFFGGGHDVIVSRRHYVDGATDSSQLASSGTLSKDEHYRYTAFTVEACKNLYDANRYARYVAVFQNWLKPAGASFDHLHKQLVAIDERGVQNELALQRLRSNPNVFNEAGPNFAMYHNLVLAENDYAVAFAGFGHRYPTIEIYSTSEHSWPWDHSVAEIGGMSDMIHAMHAATGGDVPCNEEWHHRPIDVDVAMPWRVMLKWRVWTVAGCEGGTKIYLNTIDPFTVRDRVVPKLFDLRTKGRIAPLRIAMECDARPNRLRYRR